MTALQFDFFQRALTFISVRCDIPIADIDSHRRDVPIVFARNVLIWLLRYRASMTLKQIAILLDRHHSAIHHSLRALNDRVETECATARQVASLIHEFTTRNTPGPRLSPAAATSSNPSLPAPTLDSRL